MEYLTNPTVIFFIANSLYIVSYMLTSMFWLRLLAVIAALSTFPYFYFQAEPLWSALFWQCAFLLVNLVNLILLILSKRSPNFDDFEMTTYKLKFSGMKPHEVVPIFKAANHRRLDDEERLLTKGENNDTLYLIVSGECRVERNGIDIAELRPGNFVGEFSFTSGDPTSANVYAVGETRLMAWTNQAVLKLSKRNMLLASYLHQLCNADLSEKLRSMNRYSADNMDDLESWLLDGAE